MKKSMQQPSARILLNLTGNKSLYLWNGTETYYSKLRSAYNEILNNKESDFLFFAFTTLCASTLEYSLNFVLTDYCLDKFGPDYYKTYSEEYIGLRFKNKLLMVPFIVSEGQYRMNENHSSFKCLEELITLRNRILHNKESLREFECPINGVLEEDNVIVPSEKLTVEFELPVERNHIDSLTKEKCLSFGNALGDFKKFIMTPALNMSLTENELILKI
jgi:hypothetical protein